jgi:hypothetical protein
MNVPLPYFFPALRQHSAFLPDLATVLSRCGKNFAAVFAAGISAANGTKTLDSAAYFELSRY